MTTLFLLTYVSFDESDAETVLEAGDVFASLAGAQRAAGNLADTSENTDQPRELVWQQDGTRWACPDDQSRHTYLIREVPLQD